MRYRSNRVIQKLAPPAWLEHESECWRVLGSVCGIPLELGVSSPKVLMRAKRPSGAGGAGTQLRSARSPSGGVFARGSYVEA
jgi:hypothetical protein